jgi:hypothetical protein
MESKMSTNTNTPSTPKSPKNPARGNQQGQTTLAAKIDRWEAMSNNLLPMLGEMPQLKQVHTDLQQAIAEAKALRDRLKSMKAEAQASSVQRQQVVAKGESLFSLLSFGLRFAFGPTSQRLNAFAVKPLKKAGRPATAPGQAPAPEAPSEQLSPTQK